MRNDYSLRFTVKVNIELRTAGFELRGSNWQLLQPVKQDWPSKLR